MQKFSPLLVIILCLAARCFGQDWSKYSQTYTEGSQISIVTCIEARNNDFSSFVEHNYTSKDFAVNKAAKEADDRENSGNHTFVNTFTKTPAYFFVKNVDKFNGAQYEYSVSESSGKTIVPWSTIDKFDKPGFGAGSGWAREMGFIGSYETDYGHFITVNVRKKGTTDTVSTAKVKWVSIHPSIERVYTTDQFNDFINELTHSWVNRNVTSPDLSKLKANQNNLIFLLRGKITSKTQIEYELERNGKVVVPWGSGKFDNNFIWLKSLSNGKYRLRYRYSVQPEHTGTCDFEIKPAWYQTTAIKIISGSLLAVFFGLIVLVVVLLRQRSKSIFEAKKQKRLQAELQAIRSQLNPHFIFNALSSIQSLVNKNDITGANYYLTEFSELLRATLDHADLEQLPLEKEIKILETYLKLEQLRFNFSYQIEVDNDINKYETEIPVLLLQPLLENAIKHGISNLKETGKLFLTFKHVGSNMIATVSDNGKGFNVNEATDGYGLKLVNKRIEVFNEILIHSKILLTINSDKNSFTDITLTFINWFA